MTVTSAREVTDRSDIQQLLAAYAHAVDRRDFDAVAACFLPDATAQYGGIELGPGVEHIIQHIAGVARFPASQHLFGMPLIHVDGDTATAASHALSCLVVPGQGDDGSDTVMTRGLTYHDQLVRTPDGWRIARRVHRPHWGTDVPLDWAGSPPVDASPSPTAASSSPAAAPSRLPTPATEAMRVGTRYDMVPAPPVRENTEVFDAGAVRIAVEHRELSDDALAAAYADDPHGAAIVQAAKLPVVDETGLSLHVHEAETGAELLRFDLLDEHPHYHYINRQGFNDVVAYDTAANGPMLDWAVAALRTRLRDMLRVAGADDVAARLDDDRLQAAVDRALACAERAIAAHRPRREGRP